MLDGVRPDPGGSPASRITVLDGVRGLSIALVIYGHLRATRGFPSTEAIHRALQVGDLARLGVRVFFVLSGFLITSLLLRELRKTGRVALGAFYVKRLFRIFPAYYAYLLVVVAATLLGRAHVPPLDLALAFTFTINYLPDRDWLVGHGWSLAVEEQFYLLWPPLLALAGARRGALAAALGVAAGPLFRIAWVKLSPTPEIRHLVAEAFPTIGDSVAAGCLLALLRDRLHSIPLYGRVLASRLLPPFLFAALYFLVWLELRHLRLAWLAGDTAQNLLLALLIDRVVTHQGGLAGRVLRFRPLVALGAVSFSLYLWQQIFLRVLPATAPAPPLWQQFPWNLPLAILAAVASYHLVEKPFQRLRDRFLVRESRPTPPPPSPALAPLAAAAPIASGSRPATPETGAPPART